MVVKGFPNSPAVAFTVFFFMAVSCQQSKNTGHESMAREPGMAAYKNDKAGRPSPPATAASQIGNAIVSIQYSQPSVKNRKIWGNLVRYGKIWRTGANEANVLETDQPVTINGDTLAPGKYALFTIPSEREWVVIINNIYDQWGAYDYDQKEDAMRIGIEPSFVDELQERMTFTIDTVGKFTFAWEYLRFSLNIKDISG